MRQLLRAIVSFCRSGEGGVADVPVQCVSRDSRGLNHEKRNLSSFGCLLIGLCWVKMGKRVNIMLKLDKESKEGAGGEHRFAMAEL